jgi:hypothetical protein
MRRCEVGTTMVMVLNSLEARENNYFYIPCKFECSGAMQRKNWQTDLFEQENPTCLP